MIRILLIEDNFRLRLLYTEILQMAGYHVTQASDGKEGLHIFRTEAPDLVITDLMMPEKDGLEVIIELRSAFPSVKIIAISAGSEVVKLDYLAVAQRLGAVRTLPKPFPRQDLIKAVEEILKTIPGKETPAAVPPNTGPASPEIK